MCAYISAWASRCCSIRVGNAKASRSGTATVQSRFFLEIKEVKCNIMKVKDFLMDRYGLDVKDFSNPFLNDIRNHLIYEGLCCSIVFEKELSSLENDEIHALFAKICIRRSGQARFRAEIIEQGITEIKEYLNQ